MPAATNMTFGCHQSIASIQFQCNQIPIVFRPMTVNDYSVVRNLVPGVSSCTDHHSPEEIEELLSIPTFHPCCAYREDTNELVGYAELYRMPHIGRNFDGRIERVVVLEAFRGKGLASAMCEYLIQQAETVLNCNRIELTVEKPNARHIYETKLGFLPVDTTVMRLRLPRPQPVPLKHRGDLCDTSNSLSAATAGQTMMV